ncbi:hypothetical protein V6N12_056813 [Hibiscus sabdariffa]|uniref:Uncharacterized protein n=1 Tax=Hibiscus sabdariffa TaxID=183260 RepID=A0ABR2DC56_9ROSI
MPNVSARPSTTSNLLVPNVSARPTTTSNSSAPSNVRESPGPILAMHGRSNSSTYIKNQAVGDVQLDGPHCAGSGGTSHLHESHGYPEENSSPPIEERLDDEDSTSTQHTQHVSDPAQLNQNDFNSSVVSISKRNRSDVNTHAMVTRRKNG